MTDLIEPVPGKITQDFTGAFPAERPGYLRLDVVPHRGNRVVFPGGKFRRDLHLAIDYDTDNGTPVRAMGSGPIVNQGIDPDSGNAWFVQQRIWRGPNFDIFMLYYHLQTHSLKFKVNRVVPRGVVLALADNTGWSSGPHLHVEMVRLPRGTSPNGWYSGLRLDPQPFIDGHATLESID